MIAVIKSCGSNIASIQCALNRLGVEFVLTDNPDVIQNASHVILPGVGYMDHVMSILAGLDLITLLRRLRQPVLGICLGMQLLYERSEEGDSVGLGIIPGEVVKLVGTIAERVPVIGWNTIDVLGDSCSLMNGIVSNPPVYFVHSYAAPINDYTIATTEHIKPYTAMVQKENFMGMQFHPEKSGAVGERLLKNFLEVQFT